MDILIVKTSALGDIIQALPVLEYLHEQHPGICVDWVVEKPFAEILESDPLIDRVINVETKKWRREGFFKKNTRQEIKNFVRVLRRKSYDIVLDLQGNTKSGLITACAVSSCKVGFGFASVPELPNLLFTDTRFNPPKGRNCREDYLFLAQSVQDKFGTGGREQQSPDLSGSRREISLDEQQKVTNIIGNSKLKTGKKILVCAGSRWPNKQLHIDTLAAFLSRIAGEINGSFIFIWGSPQEKLDAENLCNRFPETSLVPEKVSLPTLQKVMAEADLVISVDSLPLHLAGTTTVPTFSIFGPSSAQKYKPPGGRHEAFQGVCPYKKTFEKRCSLLRSCKTGSCTQDIKPSELFERFIGWWRIYQKESGK